MWGNFLCSFDIICTINVLFKNVRKDDLEICQNSNLFYFPVVHKCSLISRLNFHCTRFNASIELIYLISWHIICLFQMKILPEIEKCAIEMFNHLKNNYNVEDFCEYTFLFFHIKYGSCKYLFWRIIFIQLISCNIKQFIFSI